MLDDNIAIGESLFEQGQYQDAADRLRTALAATPDDPHALNVLGAALGNLGQTDEAVRQFRRAATIWQRTDAHEQARSLRNVAVVLRDKGELAPAEQAIREAIQAWPDYAAAYWTLGLILRRLERNADAADAYQKAVTLEPDDAYKHNELGLTLAVLGRDGEAERHFERASVLWQSAKSADRKFALRNWANVLIRRGDRQLAVAKLREARDADSADPSTYNSLGLALAALKDFAEAIENYEQASTLWAAAKSVSRKFALRNWADALLALGRTAEAVAKLHEAVDADPDDANTYNALGLVLAEQRNFEEAIVNYRKASELWPDTPRDRKFAFRNWAAALGELGRVTDAMAKLRQAIAADPGDAASYNSLGFELVKEQAFAEAVEAYDKAAELWPASSVDRKLAAINWADAHFRYAISLSEKGRSLDAIAQYDRAIALDAESPYPYHNKADQLFQLGRYQEGWDAWEDAFDRFNAAFKAALQRQPAELTPLETERAAYFGYMLTRVFADYAAADRAFTFVLKNVPGLPLALCGRALLYRRWVDSEDATQAIRVLAAQVMRDACAAMRPSTDPGNPPLYNDLLVLTDLYIANRDFSAAGQCLSQAESATTDSVLRRSDIAVRRGVICLGKEEYAGAVRFLREGLLDRGDDLDLQSKLGHTLLGARQYDNARRVFRRVLAVAPGHIESLIGCAGACIALGDDGDTDQYERAEQHLNDVLRYGRDTRSGSQFLRSNRIAEILYLRGYARVKRWEAGAGRVRYGLLQDALSDFERSRKENPRHEQAAAAIDKVGNSRFRHIEESLANRVGPLLFLGAGLALFAWAQLDYFFDDALRSAVHGLSNTAHLTETGYISLTFGGLVFGMAGLSLPTLLKLKVAGIELQKAAPEQAIRASGLGLSRFDADLLIDRAGVSGPYPGQTGGKKQADGHRPDAVPKGDDEVTTQEK